METRLNMNVTGYNLEWWRQVRFSSGRSLQSDLWPGNSHPLTDKPPQQQPASLMGDTETTYNTSRNSEWGEVSVQEVKESLPHAHHGWFSILGEHKLCDPVFLLPLNTARSKQPVRPARCPRPTAKSPPDRPHVLTSVSPCHLNSSTTSGCSQTVSELTLASLISMQFDSQQNSENTVSHTFSFS